ncbi:MBL fold metallo-hydrolase [Helicovermis profundi]|uniref:MBL fold metallo-hydrolase n=1 Tax=Helicovermis profundi TaxID=3065157 RepID=A0AAU9E3B8_9FIRM|nr:MBL fold metallo-hydrolase [Clostridia bacterium S502]
MIIEKLTLGTYGANCYIVADEKEKQCIIIDPGSEAEKIIKLIDSKGYTPIHIVLTHGHVDHICAATTLKNEYGISIMVHRADEYLLKSKELNLSSKTSYGDMEFTPDVLLEDGKKIKFGSLHAKVIHTPGHTKGGICLLIENSLFSGDTLFMYSYGRYDLEGGNFDKIRKSITNRLFKLNPKTLVYPGHGGSTTIGAEIKSNPIND